MFAPLLLFIMLLWVWLGLAVAVGVVWLAFGWLVGNCSVVCFSLGLFKVWLLYGFGLVLGWFGIVVVWFWFLGLVLLQSASMFVLISAPVGFSGTFSAVFSSTILIIFFSFSGKDFLLSCNYEHPLVLDRDGGEALGLLGGGGVLVNDG